MALAEAGTVAGAASGAPRPVRFIGPEKDYWRIVVRGGVLLMVTLGLYRFWLATDIRRFLWANTEIGGESLEYSGTALELLQGFLFAIALVLPIYTIFTITVLDLGAFGHVLSTSAVLLLAFLSQYGIYLARRYRLTRTVFRGLRFHQTGSAIRYSICAVWWWGWTLLTLGFAYPFTRAALERFKMRNTLYGDLPGRFEGSGWHLFIRGFLMWLAVLIPLLATLTALLSINWPAVMTALRGGGDVIGRVEKASPGSLGQFGFAIVAFAVTLLLVAILLPGFHAMVMRWWIGGIRFGEIVAVSRLRTRDVYFAYLRFIGYLIAFVVVLMVGVFFGLIFLGAFAQDGSILSEFLTVAMMVGTYVVFMLGLMTLYNAIVTLSVWRLAADSIELSHMDAITRVKAAGEASSPLGEGIADVLNLGGI
ncbi:DUF898 family protein [Pseudorhodoplanes sp.]|uniref:DUF898 family protein n=1 Tax=Pseudorhodoplanes sp. TaxID=1934341 RepID=UPI003D0DB53C